MVKNIDNTLTIFARPPSRKPFAVIGAVVIIVLLTGLIFAVVREDWISAAALAVAAVGIAAFALYASAHSRNLEEQIVGELIEWQTALPEIQRQNLNVEVAELSKILEIESGQISDLQSAYIVAEDLAMRQIQQEESVPVMRHVALGKTPFDAILVKDNVIVCVEVAFLAAPDVRQEKIDAAIRKIAAVKKTFDRSQISLKVRLMLVLVTQLDREGDNQLRAVLNTTRFSDTPVDIDIRLLDFEALQRIYVTD